MKPQLLDWFIQFFKRLGWLYILLLAAGLGALFGFAKVIDELFEPSQLAAFNEAVLRLLHTHSAPGLDAVALFLSAFGGVFGTAVVAATVTGAFLFLKRPLDALMFMLALGGGLIFSVALKELFRLPRPDLFESLAPETSFAFPSGHSTVSVCLYGYLAAVLILDGPGDARRWGAAAGLMLVPLGVIWSRLYLGVHWPSDVVGGALIAGFWVVMCLVMRHLAVQSRTRQP